MVKKQEDKNSVGREHDNSRSPVAKQARREELPSGLLNSMTDDDDVVVPDSPSAVAAQHDAIEKLRKVKQERQSPKLDPPTAAGECHSPLAQVPFFPKMSTSGSSTGGGAPAQPKPKYSNDDIMNKLSSMMTTMELHATKSDIADLRREIAHETKISISEAVDPIKDDLKDVKTRLAACENRPASVATGSIPAGSNDKLAGIISSLDPSKRRLSFIGFSSHISAEKRISEITEFMVKQLPNYRAVAIGNIYNGPYNNRVLTQVAFVEFADNDTARLCADAVKQQSASLKIEGSSIVIKPSISKLNLARNYSLKKAMELIKTDAAVATKTVVIKDRNAMVDMEVAFIQSKDEVGGTFQVPFAHLVLS